MFLNINVVFKLNFTDVNSRDALFSYVKKIFFHIVATYFPLSISIGASIELSEIFNLRIELYDI